MTKKENRPTRLNSAKEVASRIATRFGVNVKTKHVLTNWASYTALGQPDAILALTKCLHAIEAMEYSGRVTEDISGQRVVDLEFTLYQDEDYKLFAVAEYEKAEALASRGYTFEESWDKLTDGSDVVVLRVPRLPGCMAHGSSLQDAITNLSGAITEYIVSLLVDGQPVPEPEEAKQDGYRTP